MSKKQLYRIIKSTDIVNGHPLSESISIPVSLAKSCNSFSLYNGGSVSVIITIGGISVPIPANCSSGEIKFECTWFRDLLIEAELGHNFILEIYLEVFNV